MGDRRLRDAAAVLGRSASAPETKLFTQARSSRVAGAAYRMNMPLDSFRSMFEKLHRSRRTGSITTSHNHLGLTAWGSEARRQGGRPVPFFITPRITT